MDTLKEQYLAGTLCYFSRYYRFCQLSQTSVVSYDIINDFAASFFVEPTCTCFQKFYIPIFRYGETFIIVPILLAVLSWRGGAFLGSGAI